MSIAYVTQDKFNLSKYQRGEKLVHVLNRSNLECKLNVRREKRGKSRSRRHFL